MFDASIGGKGGGTSAQHRTYYGSLTLSIDQYSTFLVSCQAILVDPEILLYRGDDGFKNLWIFNGKLCQNLSVDTNLFGL